MARCSKSWVFLAVASLVSVVVAENDEDGQIEEKDHILVLNSKNFDKATKEYTQLLIEFYSPNCGHCKALEPGKCRQGLSGLAYEPTRKNF